MSAALRSAMLAALLAFAGCTAASGPAPQNRPFVMPMGGDGGGGSGGGGMGM